MIRTQDELDGVLRGTRLKGRETALLPIPMHEEQAFAVRLDGIDVIKAWRICRDLVNDTGRWPLVSICWSGGVGDWADMVGQARLFDRFPFQHEAMTTKPRDLSPAGLVDGSKSVDVDGVLERHADRSLAGRSFEAAVDEELEQVAERVGKSPERATLLELRASGEMTTLGALKRWLLAWEAANAAPSGRRPNDGYLQGFEAAEYAPPVLLLLPTAQGWESLAYLHFYGCESLGSETAIALLRRWNEQFGAELAGHFGTMLNFFVERPPKTVDDALRLAWEQETFAECTTILPGVSTFHHAQVLVGREQWFLHERP